MTKYFLKGTEEELQLGDTLQLVLTKEVGENNVKQCHLECEFTSDLIPMLMEFGVIEMKDVEKKKVLDFDDSLNQRVDSIERELLELKKLMVSLTEEFSKMRPRKYYKKYAK